MKKLLLTTVIILAFFNANANSEPTWLSGSWGVWFQVNGGEALDGQTDYDYIAGAQEVVDNLPSIGHVISSFNHSAHGYLFTLRENAYVDIAKEIHPDFVPSLKNEKIILDVINIFKNAGKKVILYVATDGPSARAGTPDKAEFLEAWESYYNKKYDGDEGLAYRTLCRGFFERFEGLVDGYWLDHTGGLPGTMEDFVAMIREVDPTVSLATNTTVETGEKDFPRYYEDVFGEERYVASDGIDDKDPKAYRLKRYDVSDPYMDFTGGHPSPLSSGAPPNSWGYEEFTFGEIIDKPTGTYDGTKQTVKHAFVPMRDKWSVSSANLIFTDIEQTYRFVRTLTDAGCGMTWSTTRDKGFIPSEEMDILKEIDSRLTSNPMPDYVLYSRPEGASLIAEPTDNIALSGTATQSSTNLDGVPSRAIDGDNNGIWTGGSVTQTLNSTNPWWQVKLGSNDQRIGQINIHNRTDDCCMDSLSNFTVSVINTDSITTFSRTYANHPTPMLTVNARGALGSIVKVSINNKSILSLAEVEVFSSEPLEKHYKLIKRNATGFAMSGGPGGANRQSIKLDVNENNYNNDDQNWTEIDRGEGYYSYRKYGTDYCIDGGNNGANNQDVYLWGCKSTNENQHWEKIDVGSGYYRLQKRNSSTYSIDGGNGGAIGQNIHLWNSSTTNQDQQWFFPY